MQHNLRKFIRQVLQEMQKDADYLKSINFASLSKKQKPTQDQDKREFYTGLQKSAEEGPIFSKRTIDILRTVGVDIDKPFTKWIASEIEKENVGHVYNSVVSDLFDWYNAESPDLKQYSFRDAIDASRKWHDSFKVSKVTGRYETNDVVFNCSDGYKIVRVRSKNDLDVEGQLMQHCVGSYAEAVEENKTNIFSLRDPSNNPHVTIEIRGGNVEQIQGKQNEPPVEKYHKYLTEWFTKTGLWSGEALKYAPVEILEELYEDEYGNEDTRLSIARSPNVSNNLLVKLSKDDSEYVRIEVAANTKTPVEILKKLMNDKNGDVRAYVAGNEMAPTSILRSLSLDSDSVVLSKVGRNPNTPPEILNFLSKHAKATVRASVGDNRNAPEDLIRKLATDQHEWPRSAVATNPNTPLDVLRVLKNDPYEYVRDAANLNIGSRI